MKKKMIKKRGTEAVILNIDFLAFYFNRAYFILLSLLFVSVLFYLFFLFASIYNTALAKDLQIRISQSKTELAKYNSEYISQIQKDELYKFAKENTLVRIADSDRRFVKTAKFLGMAE